MTTQSLPAGATTTGLRTLSTLDAIISEHSLRAGQLAQPKFQEIERRSQQRIPYARLIPVTTLVDGRAVVAGPTVHVVGKHLAGLGLDFFHRGPIPQRFAIASLETGVDQWVHLVLKIYWCRFLRSNWFDSGGRFVKVVEWPNDEFLDFLQGVLPATQPTTATD
jgi:hypothetical protein